MVQLQQAVADSKKFIFEVFDEVHGHEVTLEGVELTEDMKFWQVTFSYWLGTIKKYKTVKLRAEDGAPLGIKNSDL